MLSETICKRAKSHTCGLCQTIMSLINGNITRDQYKIYLYTKTHIIIKIKQKGFYHKMCTMYNKYFIIFYYLYSVIIAN